MNKIKDFLSYVKSNYLKIIGYSCCILCAILVLIAAFAPKTPICDHCEENEATQYCPFDYSQLCDDCYEHLEWYFLEDLFNDGSLEEFLNDMDVLLIHEAEDLQKIYTYGYYNGHFKIDGIYDNEAEELGVTDNENQEVQEVINEQYYKKLKEYFESCWIWR